MTVSGSDRGNKIRRRNLAAVLKHPSHDERDLSTQYLDVLLQQSPIFRRPATGLNPEPAD